MDNAKAGIPSSAGQKKYKAQQIFKFFLYIGQFEKLNDLKNGIGHSSRH